MKTYENYTNKELQAILIAKQIKNDQVVIVGTGLPLIGATVAKRCFTPDCCLIAESGLMDIAPPEAPGSVADLRFMNHCSVQWDSYRFMGFQINNWQNDHVDMIAFIGGAQIDMYGNINTTCIGDYHNPKVRISGSGGGNGIASYVNTVVTMKQNVKNFVEKVDFITSPGWMEGGDSRKNYGLPVNRGPQMIISEYGTFKFDSKTKKMYLNSYFPSTNPKEIQSKTGFELDTSKAYKEEAPSPEIIRIIREEIDPSQVFIKIPM